MHSTYNAYTGCENHRTTRNLVLWITIRRQQRSHHLAKTEQKGNSCASCKRLKRSVMLDTVVNIRNFLYDHCISFVFTIMHVRVFASG